MPPQREWFEKNYYEILGVSEDASQKDVTKAYRKLARELHPDANPGNVTAEERFKEVSAAYDVLGDEAKRKEYDEVRRLGPVGGMGGPARAASPSTWAMATPAGLGDILGQMFGRAAGRAARGVRGRPTTRRRCPCRADTRLRRRCPWHHDHPVPHQRRPVLHLSWQRRQAGHGAAGVRCVRWPRRRRRQPGLLLVLHAVPQLQGTGTVIPDPCPTCHGSGVETRPARCRHAHPRRGVRRPDHPPQGSRRSWPQWRTAGRPARRHPCPAPRPVRPKRRRPHRDGAGQLRRRRLGGELEVPTLDGTAVKLRLKPGTQSGSPASSVAAAASPPSDARAISSSR